MKVFINPGHDSSRYMTGQMVDCGAYNYDHDVCEAEIVLNIAVKVADYLKQAGGYEVEVLQSDNLAGEDNYSYYDSVCGCANRGKYDIFVSIHANSFVNNSVNGTETCIYGFGGTAEKLAECLQEQIVQSLGTVDRGLKQRKDLIVLKNTMMPAVLLELEFISNEDGCQKLMHRQDDFARAIARGISDFAESEVD